jgi:hypothetical protein
MYYNKYYEKYVNKHIKKKEAPFEWQYLINQPKLISRIICSILKKALDDPLI